MNKASASTRPGISGFLLNCLVASVIGGILIFLLSFVAAVILSYTENPDSAYTLCSMAISILSAIITGWICKRKNGYSAMLCGIVSGLFLIAIIFASSLAFYDVTPTSAMWQLLFYPLGAVLGAMFTK